MLPKLRITYNAPVVLGFAALAMLVQLLAGFAPRWFLAAPDLDGLPAFVGLFTHVLGHAGWDHLLGNFTLILLVGPLLEERHGSGPLLFMIATTAVITGLVHATFSDGYLLGASGVAFMMVLLGSTTNMREGELPLTFIIVAVLFLGRELAGALRDDHISQLAHLVGGAVGAGFGFLHARPARRRLPPAPTRRAP